MVAKASLADKGRRSPATGLRWVQAVQISILVAVLSGAGCSAGSDTVIAAIPTAAGGQTSTAAEPTALPAPTEDPSLQLVKIPLNDPESENPFSGPLIQLGTPTRMGEFEVEIHNIEPAPGIAADRFGDGEVDETDTVVGVAITVSNVYDGDLALIGPQFSSGCRVSGRARDPVFGDQTSYDVAVMGTGTTVSGTVHLIVPAGCDDPHMLVIVLPFSFEGGAHIADYDIPLTAVS